MLQYLDSCFIKLVYIDVNIVKVLKPDIFPFRSLS